MEHVGSVLKELGEGKLPSSDDNIKIYEKSLTTSEHTKLLMINDHKAKYLLAAGEGELYDALEGDTVNDLGKVCPLSHANRLVLNRYFDYTVPRAFGTKAATMGLGDRLGLASPGHIETVRNRRVKPILAQQSIRELTLTNRTMNDMLDAAAFAVFQEGYKDGYGADGDHIKTEEDIKYALGLGVSMLTLDCSDQIQKKYESATEEEIRSDYDALDEATKSHYKEAYLNKTCHLDGLEITFDEVTLMKNVLLYGDAITYMAHVYDAYISKLDRDFDFEISIDETETITTPSQHFFVANELKLRHVAVASLAPRFCGEFQKRHRLYWRFGAV
ncbi:tagaturonate epimerase family protein [Virgibacillus halophilus]|uniref:Tagaturonate epimerase family protein n=1 Tax=Tigheibacillus halophilus TaxID=361280 RepID=A0ABU5C422_9BACI|nr:tagaturonate epimerase family protein [Virgibacillus halophilus]